MEFFKTLLNGIKIALNDINSLKNEFVTKENADKMINNAREEIKAYVDEEILNGSW